MPSGQGGVFAAIQRRRATRQAGEHVTASSRVASNQERHCRQSRRMRIGSVTDEAMCNMAWPGWPTADRCPSSGRGRSRGFAGPHPADRLHPCWRADKKRGRTEAACTFDNGARVGPSGQPYRYSIPAGAVLIRPAKNLIGAESVQERPIDARGAGRPPDYPDWQNGHPVAAAAPQIAP